MLSTIKIYWLEIHPKPLKIEESSEIEKNLEFYLLQKSNRLFTELMSKNYIFWAESPIERILKPEILFLTKKEVVLDKVPNNTIDHTFVWLNPNN